jgi:hypothetical protein
MTCRAARKAIPLWIGHDLPARKTDRVRVHLKTCTACRRESIALEQARNAAKSLADAAESPDWSDAQWRSLMAAVRASEPGRKKFILRPTFAPILAAALVVLIAGGGTLLLLKKPPERSSAAAAQTFLEPPGPLLPKPSGQSMVSVIYVSKETGLKLVWYFNRDFDVHAYGK